MSTFDNAMYVVRNLTAKASEKPGPVWAISTYERMGDAYQLQWRKSQKTPVIYTTDLPFALGMFAAGGRVRFTDVSSPDTPPNLLAPRKMREIVVNGIDLRSEISGKRIFETEPGREELRALGCRLLERAEALRAGGASLKPAALDRLKELEALKR